MNGNASFIDFPDAKGVAFCGDVHSEFDQLVHKCCVEHGMKDTLVVVAGDCGFGFEEPGHYEDVYERNRERLSKANNWMLFVRGNHDNPAYFNAHTVRHRRWTAVPDYSVARACGHHILCVGGAISKDRSYRTCDPRHHPPKADEPLAPDIYWYDEHPVFDINKLDDLGESCAIDTVVTHTAPSFCETRSRSGLANMAIRDEDLMDHVRYERQVMDKILDYLKARNHPLRHWFYGHFHQSWHREIDSIQYDMLDIMELREFPYHL